VIPVDDGKVTLPALELAQKRRLRFARAAMQIHDHWVGAVAVLDGNPLLDTTDLHEPGLIDSINGQGRGRPEKGRVRHPLRPFMP
jgi:hypothetical protein